MKSMFVIGGWLQMFHIGGCDKYNEQNRITFCCNEC